MKHMHDWPTWRIETFGKYRQIIIGFFSFKSGKEKKKILFEFQEKYRLIDKPNLKIDLFDNYGERVNINSKNDIYANQYLIDRQCYELYMITTSKYFINLFFLFVILANTNEIKLEPAKIDGFCMRTIEEDIKYEEYEKCAVIKEILKLSQENLEA